MEIKLTLAERIIIANQFKILALLDESSRKQHQHAQDVIEKGFSYEYQKAFSYIDGFHEELIETDCRFVADTLNLFERIQTAKRQGVKLPEDITWVFIFSGFNVIYERQLFHYADYLIKRERFPNLGSSACPDSPQTKAWLYRAMIRTIQHRNAFLKITQPDIDRLVDVIRIAIAEENERADDEASMY